MNNVILVRNRGQITIPDNIRKAISWVAPLSAVSISIVKPDEIVIRPHQVKIDWDMILENIRKSRAIVGKGKGSAFDFIQQDRNSH